MDTVAIIGAGITGATIARKLAEKGHLVQVLEKSPVRGGHCQDYEEDGVLVNRYGPHIFHTSDEEIIAWALRFVEKGFMRVDHTVMSLTQEGWKPWPINYATIEEMFGSVEVWREEVMNDQMSFAPDNLLDNFEAMAVRDMGWRLYNTFLRGYTEKMWQKPARDVSDEIYKRVRIRETREAGFFDESFVGLPLGGYAKWISEMMNHPKIRVNKFEMWPGVLPAIKADFDVVVSSAPIVDLLGDGFELEYRGMRFESAHPDTSEWPTAVVNFPQSNVPYVRGTDYSRLWKVGGPPHRVVEIPDANGEPLYPVATLQNQIRAARYAAILLEEHGVVSVGRLGSFKYMDMDTAIKQAFEHAERIHETCG